MNDGDIERVLLAKERIEERVEALAREIRDTVGDGEILVVGVLTGAFVFLADLVRLLPGPVEVGFLKVTSYRDGTRPGKLELEPVGKLSIEGRDVLVVEDIIDTGRSLVSVLDWMRAQGPDSVRCVALLDKRERREVEVTPDFRGFVVPDEFLVGYGLDHGERYRGLPDVCVLRREAYRRG